jgi:hypothetical protein
MLRDELDAILSRYIANQRREVVTAFETWWDKYRVPLVTMGVIPIATFVRELRGVPLVVGC